MKKVWLAAIIFILLLGCAGTTGAAYAYGDDDRLPVNFSVGGLELGGQPPSEALKTLKDRISALEEITVVPQGEGGSQALPPRTFKQLGLTVSAGEAVRALEAYGQTPWWKRALQKIQGESGVSHDVSITWDEGVLAKEAELAWGSAADRIPVDAKREITAADEVVFTPEVTGSETDLPALIEEIKKTAPSSLSGETDNRTLNLPVAEKAPLVTVESLKSEGIERKIAEFTTSFRTSAEGRSHNVTAAAKALNDTLLQPGEVFEYGAVVDKAEKEYGYREAPVIVSGKLVPGIGGGICQVSSTLYNAILAAGLDVVERRNHSLAVSYLPPGLDATFADGFVNFRFRNSTGKQLLIRTEVENKKVTVKLFGTMPDNTEYKTETEQVKIVPPKTKYVADSKVELGQQKRVQKGANGYVVDTYRIMLVDGKETARDKMPRSNYKPQDEIIAVHPDDPRLSPQDKTAPAPSEAPVEPI